MLQAKHNSGIVPEQLNRPKRADMQLSHDYALKITFTKRQGLSGSPFEAYKFSHQEHGLNKKNLPNVFTGRLVLCLQRGFDNRGKGVGFEAGATNQTPIDIGLSEELSRIGGCYRAAI